MKQKSNYKKMHVNEAGLSPFDIIKQFEIKKNKQDEEQKKVQTEKNKQIIKSIWIRDFTEKNNQIFAELTIEYMENGKIEEMQFEVTKTDEDKHYKRIYKNLRANRKMQGNETHVTNEDVWLSMVRIAFGDYRIKWFYGKNKSTDDKWMFADETEDVEVENGYGSELFHEEFLKAKESGSSDPWADAEIACGIRDANDFYDNY